MDLSIIIPLFNEADSLPELLQWITDVAKKEKLSHEIILIDDGSRDASW
jgi:glycosyltransferase involved in cell wall biosynthesis